jgi:hypothetical protein
LVRKEIIAEKQSKLRHRRKTLKHDVVCGHPLDSPESWSKSGAFRDQGPFCQRKHMLLYLVSKPRVQRFSKAAKQVEISENLQRLGVNKLRKVTNVQIENHWNVQIDLLGQTKTQDDQHQTSNNALHHDIVRNRHHSSSDYVHNLRDKS